MHDFKISGWRLFGVAALVVVLPTIGIFLDMGYTSTSLSLAIRYTARTSVILFVLAFTASAAFQLLPNAMTQWQRANRRFFGLAFAFSHLVHAIFIVAYAAQGPEEYAAAVTRDMIVVGSIGYALIILMAATSFRVTAGWIGPRNWTWLHGIGIHLLWLQFLVAFGKRASAGGPLYWFFIGLLLAALGMRLYARLQRKDRRIAM
jgi:methionine sulfoxide reductase heme-binding subunit